MVAPCVLGSAYVDAVAVYQTINSASHWMYSPVTYIEVTHRYAVGVFQRTKALVQYFTQPASVL
jgi:hypothetical protein